MEQLPDFERKISNEERERLNRALGDLGLYDASQDHYDVDEHPEDEQWFPRSIN